MSNWEAARSHPFTYPGTHPAGGFALIDDAVHDVIWHEPPHPESIGLGAAGAMLDDILSEMHMVAEGVKTASVALELAERHGLDLPICTMIDKVVKGEIEPSGAYWGLTPAGHEDDPG